jgi:hypothetical protein
MLPPAFSDTPDSISNREFEQLIQDGIIAVKNGNRSLAKKLLDQAALINSADARIWIWLSATTDDLQERRTYLERAVALDPSNATAKRGLLMPKSWIRLVSCLKVLLMLLKQHLPRKKQPAKRIYVLTVVPRFPIRLMKLSWSVSFVDLPEKLMNR